MIQVLRERVLFALERVRVARGRVRIVPLPVDPVQTSLRVILGEEPDDRLGRRVPVLIKLAPDLDDDQLRTAVDVIVESDLDGIIATNTTISRDGLASNADDVERCGAGGLSGPPVRERSFAASPQP